MKLRNSVREIKKHIYEIYILKKNKKNILDKIFQYKKTKYTYTPIIKL